MIEIGLRVSTIRSQNPRGIGGCIFTGSVIDGSGSFDDPTTYFVIVASGTQLRGTALRIGQLWKIRGVASRQLRKVNGFHIPEFHVQADDLIMLRPTGEQIVRFIADSEGFVGIGRVKAQRLWRHFQEGLYDILDSGDLTALSTVLSEEYATLAIGAWKLSSEGRILHLMQKHRIEVSVGRKVLAFFGVKTQVMLEEDPYRLLSFGASWKQTDLFAQRHFDVVESDHRRIHASVEETLYRQFKGGDTCVPVSVTLSGSTVLLGAKYRELIHDSLSKGLTNGGFTIDGSGNLRLTGALMMEGTVARAMADRLNASANLSLLSSTMARSIVTKFEVSEQITLTNDQRLAVDMAASRPLSLILGGGGAGKMMALKALYMVFDEAQTKIFQLASTGGAAKRMSEATGRSASTIASFVTTAIKEDLAGRCVAVVYEASAVDIITMNRLCEMLPPHVRIVLAGDTAQPTPVGAGLVLHALANFSGIPKVELKAVKRPGDKIALAAAAVRGGIWPELPDDASAPISFLPCAAAAIPGLVVELYSEDTENTQIISERKNGIDGTKAINALCQKHFTRHRRPLLVYLDEFRSMAGTGFHLGDKLLCTGSLWDWGMQIGSLGRIVEIADPPRIATNLAGKESGHPIAWILWDDGARRPVLQSMLDSLELGYAVTIHENHGSQWHRVIVVLTGSKILDRTLVYSAITRAKHQVILVGNPLYVQQAVERVPKARSRTVGLESLLQEYLAKHDKTRSINRDFLMP